MTFMTEQGLVLVANNPIAPVESLPECLPIFDPSIAQKRYVTRKRKIPKITPDRYDLFPDLATPGLVGDSDGLW